MKAAALFAIIVTLIGLCHSFYDIGFCERFEMFKCDKELKSCSKAWPCKFQLQLQKDSPIFFSNIEECQKNC